MPSVLLSHRYDLGDEIGRGGMSAVYKATDELLGRNVAVKLLRLDEVATPGANERFRREAKIAASLNHPNIVTIFDAGIDGTTPFLVMELLPGPTLAEKVALSGRLTVTETLNVGEQVCRALSASHAAGIVHRDVKPSNIAYAGNGTVKVLDFGIARMIEATTGQTELTRTATVIGTASYLSPEQARGDGVSASTDLYALGCVLFTLVTGGPPFRGETALMVCSQHLHTEAPHLVDLVPHVPPALSTLLDDLLKKDPSRRPIDAEIVRSRIESIAKRDLDEDLTVPLRLPDELTSTREYTSAANGPSPQLSTTPSLSIGRFRSGGIVALRSVLAAQSRWVRRSRRRTRWILGIAFALVISVAFVVAQLHGNPAARLPAPAITTPSPAPGTSPLPAPLVRSLDNLARSVG